jgi:hypothetical protein
LIFLDQARRGTASYGYIVAEKRILIKFFLIPFTEFPQVPFEYRPVHLSDRDLLGLLLFGQLGEGDGQNAVLHRSLDVTGLHGGDDHRLELQYERIHTFKPGGT